MLDALMNVAEDSSDDFAIAVLQSQAELARGLALPQAAIPPKYFYDTQGSKLFESISALDEYYPTRTEFAILHQYGAAIAASVGSGAALIDLGAGNCAKAAALLKVLRPRCYLPVDISAAFLLEAVAPLKPAFPDLPIHPIGLDFSEGLVLPPMLQSLPQKLFFYPGSSLGNAAPLQALRLLTSIHAQGDLLLGLDLIKDVATVEAAYNDALGVTAAFNLNMLRHVNRILGSDFLLTDWVHHAFFNAAHGRIEMHLKVRNSCRVTWPGGSRKFAEGETIHTENSYKFSIDSAGDLLRRAGFRQVTCWSDPERKFLVCHARRR